MLDQRLALMSQDKPFLFGKLPQKLNKNRVVFGNHSRYAKNWIGGPSDEIREQKMPGYTGHVKGLISENINGQSFANVTSAAIYRKQPKGHDI